jgi:hypothetical protein
MGLAVSESDFYLVKDSFISNIATLLGINPSCINIVDVVSGNARRSLPEISDTTAGDGTEHVKTHNRALLSESVTVSFEIVPDASLSVSDVSVMESQGFANITIVRSANVSRRVCHGCVCHEDLGPVHFPYKNTCMLRTFASIIMCPPIRVDTYNILIFL